MLNANEALIDDIDEDELDNDDEVIFEPTEEEVSKVFHGSNFWRSFDRILQDFQE